MCLFCCYIPFKIHTHLLSTIIAFAVCLLQLLCLPGFSKLNLIVLFFIVFWIFCLAVFGILLSFGLLDEMQHFPLKF